MHVAVAAPPESPPPAEHLSSYDLAALPIPPPTVAQVLQVFSALLSQNQASGSRSGPVASIEETAGRAAVRECVPSTSAVNQVYLLFQAAVRGNSC